MIMRAGAVLAAAFSVLVMWPSSPAHADCEWVRIVEIFNGQVRVHFEERCDPGDVGLDPVSNAPVPPRDSDWDAACVRTAITVGLDPVAFCDLPPTAVVPTVTPGLVARAFRNVPLPASQLAVQPPDGRTLVNFDTNFYTEQGSFTRRLLLLGQAVELRIWPSQYSWVFGDGESLTSASAGSPYPDLEITHAYRTKGGVSPRVDTTYAAQFRVNGGPWRDVNGTVTIPGAPVPLRVVTAKPVLVGYH